MSAVRWILGGLVAFFLLAKVGVAWQPGDEPTWAWLPWLGGVFW